MPLPPWGWNLVGGWTNSSPAPLRSYSEVVDTPEYRKSVIYPIGMNELTELDISSLDKPFSAKTWSYLAEAVYKLAECGAGYNFPEALEFLDNYEGDLSVYPHVWSLGPPDDIQAIHALLYANCPRKMAPFDEVPPRMWDRRWIDNVITILRGGWCRRVTSEWWRDYTAYTFISARYWVHEVFYMTMWAPNILDACQITEMRWDMTSGSLTLTFPGCPLGYPSAHNGAQDPICAQHHYTGSVTFTLEPGDLIRTTIILNGPNGTLTNTGYFSIEGVSTPSNICSGLGTLGLCWTLGGLTAGAAVPSIELNERSSSRIEYAG